MKRRPATSKAWFALLLVICLATVLNNAGVQAVHSNPTSVLTLPSDPSPLITNYPIPTSDAQPDAIITGADNHTLWFTEFKGGNIGEFSTVTSSVTREYPINETGAEPATLAIDSRGLVWFTDQNPTYPSVWNLNTTSGTFHRFLTNTSPSGPEFVMVDSSTDYVWFTDYYGNYLGEITGPAGSVVKHPLPAGNSYPVEMTKQIGTSYLWITEETGKVARYDTATNTTETFTPSVPLIYPVGIVVDNTGNVWVGEHGGSSITELNPTDSTWRKFPTSQSLISPGTGVATLAIDSQGRFWFAEHYSNRIGRFDPKTGEMDEFNLPILGAYSLYDTVDSKGSFWFTEAGANDLGTIPGNSTVQVSIKPAIPPSGATTAGSTTSAEFTISNLNKTSSITVSLNVTSSFTTNYQTTRSEISLSLYSLTLGPGQSQNVTAQIIPDFSLSSGLYAAGIVASYDKVSTVKTVFIQVNSNSLYFIETLIPEILIAAGIVLLVFFLLFRYRRKRLGRLPAQPVNLTPTIAILISIFSLFLNVNVAWGKCPGLYPPPSGSGPDLYGIALDLGAIAFFAIVAFLLIRSRVAVQSWASEGVELNSNEVDFYQYFRFCPLCYYEDSVKAWASTGLRGGNYAKCNSCGARWEVSIGTSDGKVTAAKLLFDGVDHRGDHLLKSVGYSPTDWQQLAERGRRAISASSRQS